MSDEHGRWTEYVDLDKIMPALTNAKNHADADIGASIERFGYVEQITVDERTGRIVAGHGRLDSLRARREAVQPAPDGIEVGKDGSWLVPVQRGWASRDDDEADAYLVASNWLTTKGGWDEPALVGMLDGRPEDWFDGTGIEPADVDALLASVAADDGTTGPDHEASEDAIPEPPAEPATKRGDVWLLGPHWVMCGDCRDAADVERLLAGVSVNLAFTSPPYADRRDYDPSSGFEPVAPERYVDWFEPVAGLVAAHLAVDGSWLVNIKAGADGLDTDLYVLDLVAAHVRRWGWHFATEFCWERHGTPGEVARRFKNQFEPIYQFARGEWKIRPAQVSYVSSSAILAPPEGGRYLEANSEVQGTPGHAWFRDRTGQGVAYPGNRLPSFAGSHEATGHKAAFPVGLPEWFVRAFTDPGDTVYDPFVGSGSTILAAHHQDRRGFGLEISPGYVDVVCARFQRHTGIVPVLESTGEPHDFLAP